MGTAPCARALANEALSEQIREVFVASDATYGMPRVRAELTDGGGGQPQAHCPTDARRRHARRQACFYFRGYGGICRTSLHSAMQFMALIAAACRLAIVSALPLAYRAQYARLATMGEPARLHGLKATGGENLASELLLVLRLNLSGKIIT